MKTKKMLVEIDENQIRKEMNAQFALEMREKGYDVVFSNNTNKIVSVKPRKKDIVEHLIKKVKEQIRKRYNLDIEFTNNNNLDHISFQDRKPINSVRTTHTEYNTPRIEKTLKHKFDLLKAQMKSRYRLNIEFADDYSLYKISFCEQSSNDTINIENNQIAA